MNLIVSFLLVRCFILTLVLGFPLQLSTPSQITKYYKKQNMRECKYVEEVGFIIEPDFAGRDSVQAVQELDIPVQTSRGLNESECFFLSGVCHSYKRCHLLFLLESFILDV